MGGTDVFSDADADTLTYSIAQQDGTAKPAWLTLTGAVLTQSTAGIAGTYYLEVTATDGYDCGVAAFALNINSPPAFTAFTLPSAVIGVDYQAYIP
jgi:hypothetical protein